MAYKQKSSGLPFKELGASPAKQTKFPESEGTKKVQKKRRSKKINKSQSAYMEKHGSSSGGSDAEWNKQQADVEGIRRMHD
tara:strand:+ start:799 stop:1041 length:243 start_codon:yes stop_codon:yes gene_type:complete